jgi:hypothetical protein
MSQLFFVNNFTNHMYHIGNTVCEENQIPLPFYIPLIAERAAQRFISFTGTNRPAIRTDEKTIAAQAF